MEAKEYIKNGLENIANQFPQVQIRYAFNFEINTHIIQFDPIDAYYNLPELDAAWIPFSVEFDNIFVDESIAFIGSDSILSIIDNYEFSWNLLQKDLTLEGFQDLLVDMDFLYSNSNLPKTVIYTPNVLENCNIIINQTEFNFTVDSMSHHLFENSILVPKVKVQGETGDLIENEKYAMAA